LAVDDQRHLYVTDPENYRVLVFDSEGNFVETFGQFGIDTASFNLPIGIAVDNDGHIFVVDSVNNRVMKFAPLDSEAVQQQEPM